MAEVKTYSVAKFPKKLVVALVLVVLLVVVGLNSFYTVQYGTVALLNRFGKIVDQSTDQGLNLKLPFIDEVIVYRTQKIVYETVDQTVYNEYKSANSYSGSPYASLEVQQDASGYKDAAVDTQTKDGQQISVRFTIRFSLDPAKIKEIANTIGTEAEVVDKIVKTESRIWARNVPRNYSALDLYTGNIDNVSQEIKDKLTPIFQENGIIMDEFGIRSINFQAEYVQTIEQKQIEKEKIATEEYKAQQEQFKKQALITKAQGEAESQKLQQLTLTDLIVKKQFIEKWDGKLPTTMTGDGNGFLINLK